MEGRLNPQQVQVVRDVVKGKIVHDLGCGTLFLAEKLIELGAHKVIGVDKQDYGRDLPSSSRIRFVQSYIHDYKPDLGPGHLIFLSWPINRHIAGLVELVQKAETTIYLGKNTDGLSCGDRKLFSWFCTRRVQSYVPDKKNTLIVYTNQLRADMNKIYGEELGALDVEGPIHYFEQVEDLREGSAPNLLDHPVLMR